MTNGVAITIERREVQYGSEKTVAGYSENSIDHRATAKLSFRPHDAKPSRIKEMIVSGRHAKVVHSEQSKFINGMWNFYIIYTGE